MKPAPVPEDEDRRLAELAELRIIEVPRDEQLDRITVAASHYFGVPISLVTLVDRDRQIFKSKVGLDVEQTGRDVSFCGHAIMADDPFVVADTETDSRFADNPLVTGHPHIRFYAGYPIKGPGGHRLGTLCIIDRQPRSLTDADHEMLRVFAEAAQNRIAQMVGPRWFGSSAQLLAAATNSAGIGLWEWDVAADVLTWDDKMYALYGIEAADFTGAYEAWAAGLHPADAEQAEATLLRALAGDSEYDTQFRVVWPGGDIHWIRSKATVSRDQSGKPLSMLGLNWDITTEKKLEAEFAVSAAREAMTAFMERVEAAISELPIVLYSRGLPGHDHIDRWLLGDSVRVIGMNKTDFEAGEDLLSNVVPDDRASSAEKVAEAVAAGISTISEQFRIRGHGGTEKWIQHVAKIDGGACTETGALLDIDIAKRLSLKLNESEKMEALGRLAGGIAQDFNNALGIIANFATLARDAADDDDAEIRADLDQIIAATDRTKNLTGQLLTAYRPSAELVLTDVNHRIAALTPYLSSLLGAAVELNVQSSGGRATVLIDPDELDRVIINLALNARDAMPAGGKVDIGVSRLGSLPNDPTPVARLTVSDTGVGMDPETVCRVFEPFYTTKEFGPSAGLGLFTCFGIITEAAGNISCTSAKGVGTTFTVDLPLLETNLPLFEDDDTDLVTESDGRSLSGRAPTDPTRSKSSILIVDDDPAIRASTGRILEAEGLAVTAVGTIAAAREALLARDFDLVISDVRLPDGDGMSFVRELKGTHEDLPVLLWTGRPTVDDATEAVHAGVAALLIKPVGPADLIRVASGAIGQGHKSRLRSKVMASHIESNEFLSDMPELDGAVSGLIQVEKAFAAALSSLRVHFQPIVHASDSSVFAYEALLRCEGPLFASTSRFIAAAELLGRIGDVGLAVRTAVADELSARPDQLHTVFVNLHPSEVRADLLGSATEPLLPYASRVVLEITEQAALGSDRRLKEDLNDMRACGYRIAIDDLGEGYAGLSNLVRVNPDIVKIDMSLVRAIDRTPMKEDIVSAILGLARANHILVVAEGVETLAERATLRELGCDLLQGHLFAEAGPPLVEPRTTFDD